MSAVSELEIFVHVVNEGGFTAAARKLGVSKSHVSKQIDRLEERLGARLLNRTTRQVTPTGAGAAFFERCEQILADIEEAELAVTQLHTAPRGTLRISAPMTFGVSHLNAAICDFLGMFPELDVDIKFSDRYVDIVDEGYDLAIRIGALSDSSLIARKLAPIRRHIVASPAYLASRGTPLHPHDLRDHDCLTYTYLTTGTTWRFASPDGEEVSVRVGGRYTSNNGGALNEAACHGLGLALSPDFIAAEDLRQGRLVTVLDEWSESNSAIWAVYPHRRHLSAKVRLFVDFLAARWAEGTPWNQP